MAGPGPISSAGALPAVVCSHSQGPSNVQFAGSCPLGKPTIAPILQLLAQFARALGVTAATLCWRPTPKGQASPQLQRVLPYANHAVISRTRSEPIADIGGTASQKISGLYAVGSYEGFSIIDKIRQARPLNGLFIGFCVRNFVVQVKKKR